MSNSTQVVSGYIADKGVHDSNRLKELQALPLSQKIAIAQARIIEWFNFWEGNVYLSYSGGKDSTVLLDLVIKTLKAIDPTFELPVVFSNTGLEYPEIQKFARSKNATFVTPKMNFVEVIKTYGYPLISKEVSSAIYYARRIRPYNENNENAVGCDTHTHTHTHTHRYAEKLQGDNVQANRTSWYENRQLQNRIGTAPRKVQDNRQKTIRVA